MTTEVTPRVMTSEGELVDLTLGPISADLAGERLPAIQAVLKEIRRYESFLIQVISDEMRARGQTERRAGALVYELKPEVDWLVDNAGEMFRLLGDSYAKGDITREEMDDACKQVEMYRFNHTRLNVLAKRVPEIEALRHKVGGEPKLRAKKR